MYFLDMSRIQSQFMHTRNPITNQSQNVVIGRVGVPNAVASDSKVLRCFALPLLRFARLCVDSLILRFGIGLQRRTRGAGATVQRAFESERKTASESGWKGHSLSRSCRDKGT